MTFSFEMSLRHSIIQIIPSLHTHLTNEIKAVICRRRYLYHCDSRLQCDSAVTAAGLRESQIRVV